MNPSELACIGGIVAVDLSIELGALRLKNPVLVASGTYGWGQQYRDLLDPNLLGGLITKAVTQHPREGNSPPRIVETSCGLLNSIGLANVGVKAFIREKLPFLQSLKTTVIVNVAGSTPEEYAEVARQLEGYPGIDALEINISCPNVREGGLAFGSDPKAALRVLSTVRRTTKRFLIAKLSPNVTDIVAIAESAVDAGVEAISLINTLVGMAIDVPRQRPRLSTVLGGLSGPAIKPVALAMVWKVAQKIDLPIIGVGGIMTAQDAMEFFLAGASAVEVGTANFVDPQTPLKIIRGLEEACVQQGLKRIRQLVGKMVIETDTNI
ncbi:MAG: dihydroorotate dehydrogenase [candidate division Zixibacteria bacterium SM23_81]|nr:MAG: dihydroorotate dehydrogenase [candidate division Zixibacteria bacterium SM23_81]